MSMRSRVAKSVGYATAPKFTFAALNPGKAALATAGVWAMDRMRPARRRRARTRNALGIGAAAVAIPVGMWLGRRFWSSRTSETQPDRGY